MITPNMNTARGIAAALAVIAAFALERRRRCAGVSVQDDPPPRSARRGEHRRHRFALRGAGARQGARPVGRRREQAGGGRHDRDGGGRPRDARRLHDRVRLAGDAGVQPGDLRESRLRLDEGLRTGVVRRRGVERDDRAADERRAEAGGRRSRKPRQSPASSRFRRAAAARAITFRACSSAASREPISSTFRTRARRRACSR